LEIPQSFLAALGAANLDPRGLLLIVLLVVLVPVSYLGFENVLSSFNRWTYAAVGLISGTILLAAPTVSQGSLQLGLTGRFFGVVVLLAGIGLVAARNFSKQEVAGWLWESWKFVKQIFPLLIMGIFLAGMVKAVLPEEWVRSLAGENTLWANAIGVVFGVFMYFPTLVEVPIARMFLDLGMHRGPLLAYLLADPELSLQSILVTGRILGGRKTAVYVVLVSVFSTLAGYLFGLILTFI
jgi:uncharacterized membrane protein YraQ (UPF0718 family)